MSNRRSTDVLIIGGGPAGLAAGHACASQGLSFQLIELGTLLEKRSHAVASDLGHGIGGAGLYSDGKLSFFPSATQLWKLHPQNDVRKSFEWLKTMFAREAVDLPDYPYSLDPPSLALNSQHGFTQKQYPSIYASLSSRQRLIASLQLPLVNNIQERVVVTSLSLAGGKCEANLLRLHDNESQVWSAKSVILASGRFGPLLVQSSNEIAGVFRRLEIGVRIEQPSSKFFLSQQHQLDPKFILRNELNNLEWRTFCCCRNGEVVSIRHQDIVAVSGRSDVAQTGRSNVGYHVRFLDEKTALSIWPQLLERLRSTSQAIQTPLATILSADKPEETPIGKLFGPEVTAAVVSGMLELMKEFGLTSFSDAVLHAPALEGLATYPHFNSSLQLQDDPIWGAGDITGLFRGLVAALVSGYFAGLQVVQAHKA
jgi:uncharacterized protein